MRFAPTRRRASGLEAHPNGMEEDAVLSLRCTIKVGITQEGIKPLVPFFN